MANIKLKDPTGTSYTYNSVNLIKVPEATSGTSSFINGDNATITANDILLNKIGYNASGAVVGAIQTYDYTYTTS